MVREGSANVFDGFDCGWPHIFVAIDNEDIGALGEGCNGSLLDWEEVGGAAVGLTHFGQNNCLKVIVPLVDGWWNIPRLRFPFGSNVEFWNVFFVGDEWSAGEEGLCQEIFVEARE